MVVEVTVLGSRTCIFNGEGDSPRRCWSPLSTRVASYLEVNALYSFRSHQHNVRHFLNFRTWIICSFFSFCLFF